MAEGIDSPGKQSRLLLALDQSREGVFYVLGGTQHGQPIGRQHLGLLALGQVDLRVDAGEIEQTPAQAQHTGGLAGAIAE
ncbi:hypothetical protein D3C71_2177620 [compost metagenome]